MRYFPSKSASLSGLVSVAIVAIVAAVFSGCSSGPRTRPNAANEGKPAAGSQNNPQEQYGPPVPDNTPPVTYGPEPVQLKPITLVLGPGMARGFADVGAIRVFAENKIPIRAIYGMELGSLVAALYATDSNINDFEWKLLHFNDDIFLSQPSLIGQFFGKRDDSVRGDPDKLQELLHRTFGNEDISAAKIPLKISLQKKEAPSPTLLDGGLIASALRVSLAGPGFFGPGTYDGEPAQASSDAGGVVYLCGEARAREGGPIVLIDTGTTASDPSDADLVIRPDLDGIGPGDFNKRTDAAFRGRKAVEEQMPEIRKWVGLPEAPAAEGGAS